MLDTSSAVRPVLDNLPWHVGGVVVMAGAGAAVAASNSQNDTVTSALEGAVVGAAIGTLPAATIMLMHRGAPATTSLRTAGEAATAPSGAGNRPSEMTNGGGGTSDASAVVSPTTADSERLHPSTGEPVTQPSRGLGDGRVKNAPPAVNPELVPPTLTAQTKTKRNLAAELDVAGRPQTEPAKPKAPLKPSELSVSVSVSSTTELPRKPDLAEISQQIDPETKHPPADAKRKADAEPSAFPAVKPPSPEKPPVGEPVAPPAHPAQSKDKAAVTKRDIMLFTTPQENGGLHESASTDVLAAGRRPADGGAAVVLPPKPDPAETLPQPEPKTKRPPADAEREADAVPHTALPQANGGAVGGRSAFAAAKPPITEQRPVGELVAQQAHPAQSKDEAAVTKHHIGSCSTPQQNGASHNLAPGNVSASGRRPADGGTALFGHDAPSGGTRAMIAELERRDKEEASAVFPAKRPIANLLSPAPAPASAGRRDGGTPMPAMSDESARATVPTGNVSAKIAVFERLGSGSPGGESPQLNGRVGLNREVATQTPAHEIRKTRDSGMQTLGWSTLRFDREAVGGRYVHYGAYGPDHSPSRAAQLGSSAAADTSAVGEPKTPATTRRSPRDASPSKREAGGSRPETERKYLKCVRPGTAALKSAMRPSAAPKNELVAMPSSPAAPPATETPEPAARTLAPVLDRPVEGGASSAVAAPPSTPTTPPHPAPPAVDAAGLEGEPRAAASPATTSESSRSARFSRKKASDHGLDKLAREQKMFPYMGYLIAAELKRNQGDRLDRRSKAARLEMENVKPSDGRRAIFAQKASMYGENATVAHQFADEFESLHEKRLRLIPSPNYEKALFELEARTRSVLLRLCESSDTELVDDPPPKLTIAQRIRASLGACVGVFKKGAVIE